MRTLHFGLRVTNLERSIAFYTTIGYEIVGRVPDSPLGRLTMLKLPGDEFVTIELVHDPSAGEITARGALSHFVIKVESIDDTVTGLARHGIVANEPSSPDGSDDFRTTTIADPDGNTIELVQWPAGHSDGMTKADWTD